MIDASKCLQKVNTNQTEGNVKPESRQISILNSMKVVPMKISYKTHSQLNIFFIVFKSLTLDLDHNVDLKEAVEDYEFEVNASLFQKNMEV